MATSRRAKQVWKRLMSWYGAPVIAERFGAEPPDDWCELINRTPPEDVETALIAVRRQCVTFPPTLAQFEACIPERRKVGPKSVVSMLCEHAVTHLRLCQHQLMRTWSYFGPLEDFQSKSRGGEVIKHPNPAGVVIPSCEICGNPSHRVKVEDLAGSEAA